MDLVVDQIGVLRGPDPAAVEMAVVVVAQRGDIDTGFYRIGRSLLFGLSVHWRGLSAFVVVAALLPAGGSGGERPEDDDAEWV